MSYPIVHHSSIVVLREATRFERKVLVYFGIATHLAQIYDTMQALRLPTPSVCRPSRTRFVVRAETAVASPINPNIQKENPKVVDTVTTSSVEKQVLQMLTSSQHCLMADMRCVEILFVY